MAIAIFALTTWRKTISAALTFVAVQLAGAVAGVLVLIAQLVAYLGWDGFLIDLKLTYLSRNVGMLSPAHLAALRHFVEQHNIAFFYNFANPNVLHIGHLFLDSIFRWGLQVYTPPFAYCILILAAGVAIALFARPGRVWWPRSAIVAIAVMAGVAWLLGASTVVLYAVVVAAAAVIFAAPDSRVLAAKYRFSRRRHVVRRAGNLVCADGGRFFAVSGFRTARCAALAVRAGVRDCHRGVVCTCWSYVWRRGSAQGSRSIPLCGGRPSSVLRSPWHASMHASMTRC